MQQTKSYWRLMAAAGVVGACFASACVVTTSSDDGFAGAAGTDSTTAGSGGASTAGATSAGGTAGSSTATAGTGGAVVVTCDMDDADGMVGTPAADCNATAGDTCSACLQATCCSDVEACNGTNPNNQCGFGGLTGEGEFNCVATCMKQAFAANGNVELPDDLPTCAGGCGTAACGNVIGAATNDLIACAHADGACAEQCFQ